MPRNFLRKTQRSSVKSDVMLRAVHQVRFDNKSVRGTARDFGINYQMLLRYCNKSTDVQITGHHGEGYRKNRQIFMPLLEEELVRYILRTCTSEIYQGVSPKEVRKLAYQLALANNLPIHKTWLERKLAGAEWFPAFLKRHPSLSIRKPQAIYDIPGILSLVQQAKLWLDSKWLEYHLLTETYSRRLTLLQLSPQTVQWHFLSLQQINLIL